MADSHVYEAFAAAARNEGALRSALCAWQRLNGTQARIHPEWMRSFRRSLIYARILQKKKS